MEYDADSIALDLVLVIEIVNDAKEHFGSLLVETSTAQYYDVRRSDRNPHFHIVGAVQKKRYMSKLGAMGFEEVHARDLCRDRPKRYFIQLRRYRDYYLDEITVRNNILRNNTMRAIMSDIPFEWIAQKMFVDEYSPEKKIKNGAVRSNIRWDAGFTGLNTTDTTKVPGMHMPGRNLQTSKQSGAGYDETREHTMFKAGCRVMEMAEYVRMNHPNPSSRMAEEIFRDDKRNQFFSRSWAEELDPVG